MNGNFVFLVFIALVPPLWLGIGLVGLVVRSRRPGTTLSSTVTRIVTGVK